MYLACTRAETTGEGAPGAGAPLDRFGPPLPTPPGTPPAPSPWGGLGRCQAGRGGRRGWARALCVRRGAHAGYVLPPVCRVQGIGGGVRCGGRRSGVRPRTRAHRAPYAATPHEAGCRCAGCTPRTHPACAHVHTCTPHEAGSHTPRTDRGVHRRGVPPTAGHANDPAPTRGRGHRGVHAQEPPSHRRGPVGGGFREAGCQGATPVQAGCATVACTEEAGSTGAGSVGMPAPP